MVKYYTRACNFYYGQISKDKINKKKSLPLNGNKLISFDSIELITRKKKRLIKIKNIKSLRSNVKKKILKDLKEIKIIEFTHNDVVRHPLVSKIIRAYQNKSTDDKN